jgi:glycosyltransferase involved in cell wall biosynthesis
LDVYYFDPEAHEPLPLPLTESRPEWWQWCNKNVSNPERRYKFFSNFKWEPRKGWDVLFEAYDAAFGKPARNGENSSTNANGVGESGEVIGDDVSLYVLSFFFFNGPSDGGNIHNVSLMLTQLEKHVKLKMPHIASLADLPHFCIITETVSEEDLVRVYRSMDAFVLPTRGEGWGLPTIQAMSMGMPTISTNWGGNTEFMTPETSFLIPIDGLEELPRGNLYGTEGGKKWALPSVSALTGILKYVKDNPEHAAEVGRRARRHVSRHFSEAALVDLVDARLEAVREILWNRRTL